MPKNYNLVFSKHKPIYSTFLFAHHLGLIGFCGRYRSAQNQLLSRPIAKKKSSKRKSDVKFFISKNNIWAVSDSSAGDYRTSPSGKTKANMLVVNSKYIFLTHLNWCNTLTLVYITRKRG